MSASIPHNHQARGNHSRSAHGPVSRHVSALAMAAALGSGAAFRGGSEPVDEADGPERNQSAGAAGPNPPSAPEKGARPWNASTSSHGKLTRQALDQAYARYLLENARDGNTMNGQEWLEAIQARYDSIPFGWSLLEFIERWFLQNGGELSAGLSDDPRDPNYIDPRQENIKPGSSRYHLIGADGDNYYFLDTQLSTPGKPVVITARFWPAPSKTRQPNHWNKTGQYDQQTRDVLDQAYEKYVEAMWFGDRPLSSQAWLRGKEVMYEVLLEDVSFVDFLTGNWVGGAAVPPGSGGAPSSSSSSSPSPSPSSSSSSSSSSSLGERSLDTDAFAALEQLYQDYLAAGGDSSVRDWFDVVREMQRRLGEDVPMTLPETAAYVYGLDLPATVAGEDLTRG